MDKMANLGRALQAQIPMDSNEIKSCDSTKSNFQNTPNYFIPGHPNRQSTQKWAQTAACRTYESHFSVPTSIDYCKYIHTSPLGGVPSGAQFTSNFKTLHKPS
ncbi:hypothetical protein B0H13DRAFT_1865048 [Mycena leptocephala]|nr:hypothetical protein B0H13DRAFT_1865048 [Mycena leptocephala]